MRPLRLLAILLGMVLLPVVSAAQHDEDGLDRPMLAVPAPPPRIEPGAEPVRVPVQARVPCAWLDEGPAVVTFGAPEVQGAARASWFAANVTPAQARTPEEGCLPGMTHAVAAATLEVAATREAIALTPTVLRLGARLEAAAEHARELVAEVPVEAAYVGKLEAGVAQATLVGKPQSTVTFLVTLVNQGNQNTRVSFSVDGNPGGLNVVVPSSVILGPAQARDEGGAAHSVTVPVAVQTPYRNGHLDEASRFTLRVHGAYALDPAIQGDAATLDLEVRTVGTYVPAPPAPLLLAVLGLAAILARRR